ncbi:glycosyltransferase family 4 protein [Candidatus Pacearchaeota archaeon]|nr:glycosyltransferase family 4 protein [Candidatus Pacearchaeota archaeon]
MEKTIKRIAFFTVGFAFNRQNRMIFYEEIFPKNVEIYLITTNKFYGKEKEKYQQLYKLNRTKIVTMNYNLLTLPIEIRKFCKEREIEMLVNLGFHISAPLLIFATVFLKTKFALNILVDVFNQYRLAETFKDALKEILILASLFPIIWMSDRVFINDRLNYRKALKYFMQNKKKFYLLYAPVNSDLFKVESKSVARKRIGFPIDEKIIIFAGRLSYLKCSDILGKLIVKNPDIQFILIGRMMDKNFDKNVKNVTYMEKLSSQELFHYYNASDLGFYMTRHGGGMGITAMEMLSCGVPVIIPDCFDLHNDKSIFQMPYDVNKVDKKVKEFFNLNKAQKIQLRNKARKFAERTFSYKALKKNYLKSHLM